MYGPGPCSTHGGGGAVDGYMSDGGEAFRLSGYSAAGSGFDCGGGSPHRGLVGGSGTHPAAVGHDDGYLSEGGASLYARKIQTRIAIEKQKVTSGFCALLCI